MVITNDDNRVRTIALNRPDALNAFNGQQYDDLTEALLDARADDKCRVVVLTGTGRAFSAGADLSGAAGPPPKHGFRGLLHAIVDFPKPFVLGINGLGVGIGATLCGVADFVFMAASARLAARFPSLAWSPRLAAPRPSPP